MSDRRFRFERDARRDRELDEAEYRGESSVRRLSPGKRARSARLGGGAPAQAVVQHRREGAAVLDDEAEREIAARGAFDPAGPLPYLEELQRAFGRHQLGDVRVATGSDAERANQEMGSVAYAMGEAIVFRDPNPDLFTVAHEAAHVVQQRAGAVASGTVGRAGDRHEAHADAVAERVVRGESAEDLLDQVAAGGAPGGGRSGPAPVQRLDDEDYEGLSTYQAIWRALLDDEAEDALALMGRIEGAGEANLVLNSAQALARRCFDDGEMAEAAGILVGQGGSLGRALEWMWDEGNDWIEVLTVISCATREQRAALTTDTWRARLVSELDADEMSALVDLLGLSLHDQLTWMWQVGVDDWSLVRSKIVAAPDDERAALVTDEWRDWFVDEFDSDEVSELVDLLPMPLESKLWWMWAAGADDDRDILAKIQAAAPDDDRSGLATDSWRDWFLDVFDDESMSRLVDALGLPLVKKLEWLAAVDAGVEAMIGKIALAPAAERPAVYDADLRDFFVGACNDEEMAVVVILLGGTVAQQLSWMAAEGSSAELVLDRVKAAPEADRPLLYDDSAVLDMIREFVPIERAPIIEAAGGTPEQQMDLLGAESLIRLLTWATPSADWVDAIMKHRSDPLDLLEVAKADPAAWGPLIQPKLWDLLASHEETLYPEDRVAVFWAAYGTGQSFTADQIMHFFELVFGREIQPASEDITVSTGMVTRTRFSVVAPTDASARGLMDCVRPGSGGSAGIGRSEVSSGTIAFCTEEHKEELGIGGWTTLSSEILATSYFWRGYVIIRAVGRDPDRYGVQEGAPDTDAVKVASDGTPSAVGSGLTYFQNHVRHEIGHAVGARVIGSMSRSGNEFALEYGGWQESSESEFLAVMWSGQAEPATGWPALFIGAASVTVTDDDVRDWCISVISSGQQPDNPLGNAPGDFAMKKGALAGSIWVVEKMVWYLLSIPCSTVEQVPGTAFKFPGFTPPSPVPIFSTRWGDRFATYSTEAFDAFRGISWYARSSPVEMFAEMYTARYSGQRMPAATSGGDPEAFFTELEAQRDPMFGEPPPDEPALNYR